MNIYISWSGERSRSVARILRHFISVTLQSTNIFSSTDDISNGSLWANELSRAISETDVGILCLTSDNLNSSWLSFEAGSLLTLKKLVIPVLLDLSPSDLVGPLMATQAVSISKPGIQALIQMLNDRVEHPQPIDRIRKIVDTLWPDIEKEIATIPPPAKETSQSNDALSPEFRSDRELLLELLERVEKIENEIKKLGQ